MKNTKQSNKPSKETLARRNAFFSATPEQLAQVLKNTQSLTVQTRKVFTEEEKQHITPKQTKKTTPAKVAPVSQLVGKNNPEVVKFQRIALANFELRREESLKRNSINNSFDKDTNIFEVAIKNYPEVVYTDLINVAKLTAQKNPAQFALQFVDSIAILDKNSPNFVAQKELNKLVELVSALASGRKCNNHYVVNFAKSMVFGHMTLSQFKMMYYALNKKAKINDVTREQFRKQGADNYTIGTASAQSGQVKKLCRALGLINYTKNKKDTPIQVNDNALKLFGLIAGIE